VRLVFPLRSDVTSRRSARRVQRGGVALDAARERAVPTAQRSTRPRSARSHGVTLDAAQERAVPGRKARRGSGARGPSCCQRQATPRDGLARVLGSAPCPCTSYITHARCCPSRRNFHTPFPFSARVEPGTLVSASHRVAPKHTARPGGLPPWRRTGGRDRCGGGRRTCRRRPLPGPI
jgi:hypothetical protein